MSYSVKVTTDLPDYLRNIINGANTEILLKYKVI